MKFYRQLDSHLSLQSYPTHHLKTGEYTARQFVPTDGNVLNEPYLSNWHRDLCHGQRYNIGFVILSIVFIKCIASGNI